MTLEEFVARGRSAQACVDAYTIGRRLGAVISLVEKAELQYASRIGLRKRTGELLRTARAELVALAGELDEYFRQFKD